MELDFNKIIRLKKIRIEKSELSTIERGEKYVTIRHDETGLVVTYTSEERLNVKH